MGRSQQAAVNTLGTNMTNTENATATNALNTLMPSYQAELAKPGLTPEQKTAQINATEGGVGAAFGSEAEGAANRAARTNNTAGLNANQDALARQRMITSGNLAAQNEAGFTAAERADRNSAQAGIGNIFGTSTGAANNTLGTLAHNAQTPGFWDTLGSSFANALGKSAGSISSSAGGVNFG